MRLEEFAGRGMRAQAAADQAVAKADTTIRLTKIVVDHLGVAESDVGPDVLLLGDERRNKDKPNLGGDSLDIVELCMAAEDEFNIEVYDDETDKLNGATFDEFVDFIHAKREARS
jgi:acyl carrier protein